MAVLSKEEFMNKLNERFIETDDDTLKIIEDFTDTFNDFESRTLDKENYKEKYEKNDKEWREKYRLRFFGENIDPESVKTENEEDIKNESENKSYEDLFEEREG